MSFDEREGDLTGQRLGSYRIEGHLGQGSMATVWRARDVLTRAEVALKIHTRKENEASKRRFFQEARAANLLKHPGIVEVLEVGVEGDVSFIAMELVRGATLATVMQGGALPYLEVVRLAAGIASALGHAHAAGVMHRDLKPSNVLLTPEGRVKLVDFGLAKRFGSVPDAGDGATVWDWSDVHTQPGAVLGTPAYMSPEQARAAHVDARADVFSLGVLMWEAIAGKPLFRRVTPAATLRAILTEAAPDLTRVVDDVPAWLAAVVVRALSKDPAARFEDARELLTELRAHEGGDRTASLAAALSRIAERHSMVLAEPAFVGRVRELHLLASALELTTGSAVLVGLPGSGRKRLARHALAALGATRPLLIAYSDPESLKQAFYERAYDSVIVETRGEPASLVERGARAALGERVRLVVIASSFDETSAPVIGVGPLSSLEGAALLAPFLEEAESESPSLAPIVRGVGGHAQSLLAIAARLGVEEPASIAAALELDERWPEILAPLGSLRAFLAAEVARSLSLLSALASVPSVSEEDALALAETHADAATLAALRRTALVVDDAHPDLIGARRLSVPTLVRRVLFELGDAQARAEARRLLLTRLASRTEALAHEARVAPERETVRELLAERETVLDLVARVLAAAGAESEEDAARAVVALAEADALRDPRADVAGSDRASDGMIEGDHLLGRLLARGALSPPLTLRILLARSARRLLELSSASVAHVAGLDDALSLARSLGDRGAESRLLLSRAGCRALGEDDGATRADIEAALAGLPPTSPAWLRADVLEHAGELRWSLGEPDAARGALLNARALAEERRDARAEARLRHRLARLDAALDRRDHVRNDETTALELALASGDSALAGRIEASLAELAFLDGDADAAHAHVDRAAAHGPTSLGRAALIAGHLELAAGRLDRARALYASSLRHAELQRDEPAIAIAHAALAAALAASFDRASASDALVRATLAARTQSPSMRLVVAGWRGHLERTFVDRDRAISGTDEAPRVLLAEARFLEAGLMAGAASEAGTGAHVGLHVLRASR